MKLFLFDRTPLSPIRQMSLLLGATAPTPLRRMEFYNVEQPKRSYQRRKCR